MSCAPGGEKVFADHGAEIGTGPRGPALGLFGGTGLVFGLFGGAGLVEGGREPSGEHRGREQREVSHVAAS